MRRILQVTLAFALAAGWQLTPPAARPAVAACTTASCATLEIVFGHGAGTGLATTFPMGMDCEWTGSTRAGTCVVQYDVGGGLDLTLYLDPGPRSYACYGNACGGGLETRLERTIHLNPGDNIDVFPVFNLGERATVQMTMGGTGDGRVTSVPAGLNCRWLDGVKTGTCRADFYFYPAASYTVQIHRTPDTGSFACSTEPPFCGVPNQVFISTTGVSPDYMSGPPANFFEAKPVAVTISGSGSVVSDPAGIDCPAKCSVWLTPNYSDDPPRYTRLTANPADGWVIKDWTGVCDGTTGATCQFSLYTNGAIAGVVFTQTSTPKPSPKPSPSPRSTPRPTATPRPAVTPRPSAPPAATAGPGSAPPNAAATPGGLVAPGASAAPASAEPAGSADPAATGEPAAPQGPSIDPSAVAVVPSGPPPVDGTQAPASSAEAGQPPMADLTLLVALLVVVLSVLLAIGFALGRRRGSSRQTSERATLDTR
jgi:hypothetical protein